MDKRVLYPLLGTGLVRFQLYMRQLHHVSQRRNFAIVFISKFSMVKTSVYRYQSDKCWTEAALHWVNLAKLEQHFPLYSLLICLWVRSDQYLHKVWKVEAEPVILLLPGGHWETRCCCGSYACQWYLYIPTDRLVRVGSTRTHSNSWSCPISSFYCSESCNKNTHNPWQQVLASPPGHPWDDLQAMRHSQASDWPNGLILSGFNTLLLNMSCWPITVSRPTPGQRHQHCIDASFSSHHCIRSTSCHKTPTLYHS